jgi:hypothetical protein
MVELGVEQAPGLTLEYPIDDEPEEVVGREVEEFPFPGAGLGVQGDVSKAGAVWLEGCGDDAAFFRDRCLNPFVAEFLEPGGSQGLDHGECVEVARHGGRSIFGSSPADGRMRIIGRGLPNLHRRFESATPPTSRRFTT